MFVLKLPVHPTRIPLLTSSSGPVTDQNPGSPPRRPAPADAVPLLHGLLDEAVGLLADAIQELGVVTEQDLDALACATSAFGGVYPGVQPERDAGCRWVAVRHADDHIHILATLAREDGYRPDLDRDAVRVQAEARLVEQELGLRRLKPGDGTAAQRPTSAERHKAERQGRERTAREELRETVRRSVAGARSEREFFGRLAAADLLVQTRVAPSGDLLGYKVALPDDRNKDGEPVYYPGARLAPDLSLPRIRERWSADTIAQGSDTVQPPQPAAPATARRSTAAVAWQALLVVEQGEDGLAAALRAARRP